MNELYSGELKKEHVEKVLAELLEITNELKQISVDKAIWDIENLSLKAPWGGDISNNITDLGNYFVTSDGDDFLIVFRNALEKAKILNTSIKIESL